MVAAITGYALGGGCELALCADCRVCGDNAKVGQPEIQLGIIPGAGGTQRLPGWSGPAGRRTSMFTGRFVEAEEALAIGLVDEVVPADEVYAAAQRWASQFVGGPAVALRAAKDRDRRAVSTWTSQRAGAREPAVLRPVRHRGPRDRHAVVRRERAGQGQPSRGSDVTRCPIRRRTRTPPPRRSRPPATTPSSPTCSTTTGRRRPTTRSGRSPTTSAASTTPATGSPPSPGTQGWPYGEALELGSGTGFFLLNLMQAGVARRRVTSPTCRRAW